jgi:hypothetical protein
LVAIVAKPVRRLPNMSAFVATRFRAKNSCRDECSMNAVKGVLAVFAPLTEVK